MNEAAGLEPSGSTSPIGLTPGAKNSVGYLKCLLLWTLALSSICCVSGRWQPHLVSDSASYLQYPFYSAPAMARYSRSPVYPAGLRAARSITLSEAFALQLVVFAQIILQAFAVSLLMIELLKWGLSRWMAIAAAATVAIGCPFWDNVSTISTDSAAMSIGVIAAVCILRGWRAGFSPLLAVGLGLCVLLAISLRPAYLFLLPWTTLMLLYRAGSRSESWRRRCRDAVVAISIPVVVLLAWCLFRFSVAGDFSLLPFGHQNMAAVTTQLLDNGELQQISGETGELAREIARRRVAVATGTDRPVRGLLPVRGPLPVSGDGLDLRVTSDPALRADSYMTLENRWDAMTYLVVIPAAASVAGEDPIDQHRLLAQLDRQIVRAYPMRYARWWFLAIRRGIWGSIANIVMHPIFLSVIVIVAGAMVIICVRPQSFSGAACLTRPVRSTRAAENFRHTALAARALTLIAISYAAMGLAFVALTSPPIGRFSDAAFVFLPSIVVIAMGQLFSANAALIAQHSTIPE